MQAFDKARLQAHLCVFLWGFTAVLGKLITLPAMALVCWRMLLVSGSLMLVPRVWRGLGSMPTKLRMAHAGIGVLLALQWLIFYAAIKLSNASVGAISLALIPAFLAFVEPWLAKRRFDLRELLIAVAVLPGVAMTVGGVQHHMRAGMMLGLLAALLWALFSSFNKRIAGQGDPLTVTGIQSGAGALFLLLLASIWPHQGAALPLPNWRDGTFLAILSFACTLLPFLLMLAALRHMSAFAMQMITNMETVYSIVLAMLLLGEQRQLNAAFYGGVVMILASVFVHSLLHRKEAGLDAGKGAEGGEAPRTDLPVRTQA